MFLYLYSVPVYRVHLQHDRAIFFGQPGHVLFLGDVSATGSLFRFVWLFTAFYDGRNIDIFLRGILTGLDESDGGFSGGVSLQEGVLIAAGVIS